jgi:hypothetical protein
MPIDSEHETTTGLTTEDVAQECHAAYLKIWQHVSEDPLPDWESISEGTQHRWAEGISCVFEQYEREVSTTWQQLAEKVACAINGPQAFAEADTVLRKVWEAITRHAINLIVSEDQADLQEARGHDWMSWLQEEFQGNKPHPTPADEGEDL